MSPRVTLADFVGNVLGPRSLVVLLDGYFDESGTHDQAQVTAVAGFVAPRESWQQMFEGRWRSFLNTFDLDYFHMVDFENPEAEPYKHWSQAKRVLAIQELTTIIGTSAMLGVGVAVRRDYFERVADLLRDRMMLEEPYHLCAHLLMLQVSAWVHERHPGEDVGYMFEEKPKAIGDLMRGLTTLNEALGMMGRPLARGPITFGEKKKVLELQAADFLAYETMKQGLRAAKLDERPTRKSLISLLRHTGVEYQSILVGEDLLKSMQQTLEERTNVPVSPAGLAAGYRLAKQLGPRPPRPHRRKSP